MWTCKCGPSGLAQSYVVFVSLKLLYLLLSFKLFYFIYSCASCSNEMQSKLRCHTCELYLQFAFLAAILKKGVFKLHA